MFMQTVKSPYHIEFVGNNLYMPVLCGVQIMRLIRRAAISMFYGGSKLKRI